MMDYRSEPNKNEGNDGYIWSKRLAATLVSLCLTLAIMVVNGGFISFGR